MPTGTDAPRKRLQSLWITRINAGAKMNGMSYSQLIGGLKKAGVELDRKVLANMAILDPTLFQKWSKSQPKQTLRLDPSLCRFLSCRLRFYQS